VRTRQDYHVEGNFIRGGRGRFEAAVPAGCEAVGENGVSKKERGGSRERELLLRKDRVEANNLGRAMASSLVLEKGVWGREEVLHLRSYIGESRSCIGGLVR